MKTAACILIAGMMTGHIASQEAKMSTQQHQKKVYVDSAHNKIFWPLDKPFWVRISESPEKDAPSYLLRRDRDSTKIPPGTMLDCTGTQTLRWFNTLTLDTEKLRFTADGEPPSAALTLVGSVPFLKSGQKFKSGETTFTGNFNTQPFFGKRLIGRFSAEDRHSGIEQQFISINNAPFAPAAGDIAFTQEGRYKVSFYAIDRVGNACDPSIIAFSIDTSAPVTTPLSNGKPVENGSMLSPAQSIIFTAFDTLSGIKEFQYRIDARQFSLFTGPIAVRDLTGDKHTISFFAIDNVGNTEAAKTVSFAIDNEPPLVALVFEGDRFSSPMGLEYISPRTTVRINGKDGKSGLDKIEYKIGAERYSPYTAPFSLWQRTGSCVVDARAFDKAGNGSAVCRASARMDSRPPHTKHALSGPVFGKSDGATITPETRITLSAADNESGVKAVRCRVDNGNEVSYTAPLAFSDEGRHVLKYWSIDNVNNREDTQTVTLSVDNTPPKIIETFSIESAGEPGGQKILKYPPSTMLYLAATDASGVAGIWYSINGKPKVKYSGDLRFDAKGKYILLLNASDNLGKTNEKMVSFEIGD